MKISAIIIVLNGEKLLPDCIDSLKFCDEILVVDGGSVDKTVLVAKELGARVIQGTSESFAEQRNIGLSHAKGEWVLYVDVDERVSPELQNHILDRIKNNTVDTAYTVQRKNFYLGNHPWPKIELLERVFKKNALKGWYGKLHESPKITGSVGNLQGFLFHYTHQDLATMVEKTNVWSEIEAELRYKNKHPHMVSWRFFRVMLTAWYDSYIKQAGWKAGTAGVVESIYQAFSIFITYAKLWELQQK